MRNGRMAGIAGAALAALCAPVLGVELTVHVDAVRNANGTVRIELDDSQQAWDDKVKPVASVEVKARVGLVSYTFRDLAPGAYAIVLYHDENDNHELDTNFFGIPKEGFGFSNNPKSMRKPGFEDCKFEVTGEDSSVTIHLNYLL